MRLSNSSRASGRQGGYVVIGLLVIVAILLIYIMANMRYLRDLNRELKIVERQQIQRLQKPAAPSTPNPTASTNKVSTLTPVKQ